MTKDVDRLEEDNDVRYCPYSGESSTDKDVHTEINNKEEDELETFQNSEPQCLNKSRYVAYISSLAKHKNIQLPSKRTLGDKTDLHGLLYLKLLLQEHQKET